jgi:hypothetical protein
MVEYLVVQVASGPEVRTPTISFDCGTMTVTIPAQNAGTILAATIVSSLIPDSAIGRIVTTRLIPLWDDIQRRAEQIAQLEAVR